MPDHKIPTTEELDVNIESIVKEVEKEEKLPDPPEDEEGESLDDKTLDSLEDKKEVETKPEVKAEGEAEAEGEKQPEAEAEAEKAPDYQKKFIESTREALVINAKNKQLNKAIEEAGQINDVTDDEVKAEFPEWEEMTATEQKLAKDNLLNKKRFQAISKVSQESKDIDAWNQKVDVFIEDPQTLINNPDLEGKVEKFKIFASKPTRRGIEFSDLVLAFMGDVAKNKPAPKKGQMFETGSGGPDIKTKPPTDKISFEQGQVLKDRDYREYVRLLQAGKIADE